MGDEVVEEADGDDETRLMRRCEGDCRCMALNVVVLVKLVLMCGGMCENMSSYIAF